MGYHIPAAFKVLFAHRWIFGDKNVSSRRRLICFDAVVTPIACFAAGHRKVYAHDSHKLDVAMRRMLRSTVGAPSGMDWTRPWHAMLHDWNTRVQLVLQKDNILISLPPERWVQRALNWNQQESWNPGRRCVSDRPILAWEAMIVLFCRWKQRGLAETGWRGTSFAGSFPGRWPKLGCLLLTHGPGWMPWSTGCESRWRRTPT